MAYDYDSVLKARKREEKALKLKISEIQQDITAMKEQREEMFRDQRKMMQALRGSSWQDGRNIQQDYLEQLQSLRVMSQRCRRSIIQREEKIEELHEEYREVARSRKLLEKHKDKMRALTVKKHLKKEENMTDNYAIHSYNSRGDRW